VGARIWGSWRSSSRFSFGCSARSKLVKTYLASGDLSQDDVRATTARTRIGIAERNVTEFWLSEPAALFIIAKSETARKSGMAGP